MSMQGKSALVTGSTSGIGLGIAECLAAEGMHIVLNGFGDQDEIEAIARRLRSEHDVRVRYEGADLSVVTEIEAMMQTLESDGGIDVLVNNAGIQHVAPIEDFPVDRWDAVMAINLSAAWHTMRLAVAGMKARGYGRIINIASAHGLRASAGKSAYVAAKHGLVGLTKVVALETAETPVTCNAVCPGWVLTPLVQQQIEKRAEQEGIEVEAASAALLGEKQPSGAFVTPAQLGAMCVFLCGSGGAEIRGAALSMDGGWTAR